jgi:putative flippase GtrA
MKLTGRRFAAKGCDVQREKLLGFIAGLLKFGCVGGTVMFFNLALLALASRFLGPHVSFLLAYVPAVTLHFLLNKWWVFRCERRDWGRQIAQYASVAATNFVINFTLYTLALRFVSSNTLLANLLALPAATAIGYVLFRQHVFQPQTDDLVKTGDDTDAELEAS